MKDESFPVDKFELDYTPEAQVGESDFFDLTRCRTGGKERGMDIMTLFETAYHRSLELSFSRPM